MSVCRCRTDTPCRECSIMLLQAIRIIQIMYTTADILAARAIISFLLSAVFRDRSCTANVKSSLRIPCILRFAALIRISCINSVRCCVRAAKSICLKTHLKFWTAALKIIHPIPAVQKSQCCRLLYHSTASLAPAMSPAMILRGTSPARQAEQTMRSS